MLIGPSPRKGPKRRRTDSDGPGARPDHADDCLYKLVGAVNERVCQPAAWEPNCWPLHNRKIKIAGRKGEKLLS